MNSVMEKIDNIYNIAILGAGPIGSLFAILLSRNYQNLEKILIIDNSKKIYDARSIALNYSSVQLLRNLEALPNLYADINHVHISQKNYLGKVLINNYDYELPLLGSVVMYTDLKDLLNHKLLNTGIKIIYSDKSEIIEQNHEYVKLKIDSKNIHTKLLIKSDGNGDYDIYKKYNQYAIVTKIRAKNNKKFWAWERFTNTSSIAVLPHPYENDTYSIIWCNSKEQTDHLMNMNIKDFSKNINDIFGTRLGRIEVDLKKYIFPLILKIKENILDGRIVSIGNAAQTIHPITGQGLNLGIRDVEYLNKYIRTWLYNTDENPHEILYEFSHKRNIDRNITIKITDILSRLFINRNKFMCNHLGCSMMMMDMFPFISYPLSKQMIWGFRL